MAYRIHPQESIEKAVQRIAREQIDKAIGEIDDEVISPHTVVHQVRKRCKKIRGLIRLVRPQFERTYEHENGWYRDAARSLSRVRDAEVLVETIDALLHHFGDQIDGDAFATIRRQSIERRKQISAGWESLQEKLGEFRERMLEGRNRIAGWRLQDDGFDAVAGGLRKTYTRGRDALEEAYQAATAEKFHEWRKRVKYHSYHIRLLQSLWQGPLEARESDADVLSDLLGDDHNLSVLRVTVTADATSFGDSSTMQAIVGLMTQRQVELRTRARALGTRVFAEKPLRFVQRLQCYWEAWRSEAKVDPATADAHELVV